MWMGAISERPFAMYRVLGIAALLCLAGCASQTSAPLAPLNAAEAAFARAPGRATVKGQMFMRRNDGVVVYGAGSEAKLIPKMSHTDQVIRASFPSGKLRYHVLFGISNGSAPIFDPALTPYIRMAKADGQGNFNFQQVPPGNYYLLGHVEWCAPSRGGCDSQGGDIFETVIVRPADIDVAAIMNGE